MLEILDRNLSDITAEDGNTRCIVIGIALDILADIHTAFISPANKADEYLDGENAALEDAKRRRMLHALLDLISLEGIYPCLSSGVGIPLQQRVISVLPAGVIAKQAHLPSSSKPNDEALLDRILSTLFGIVFDVRPSIQPVIHSRILSDMISGVSDLAFNSFISSSGKQRHKEAFGKIIEECVSDDLCILYILTSCRTPSPLLLPTLSSFLQSAPAPWFKSVISSQLSRVPLRKDGVLQTILFIASQFAPSLGQEAQTQVSNGPHFTVQAIMQTSRLLSSVPQDMDPVVYFTRIAPQLLALIDGDDPDLKKTAAYVIGDGILGKRAYGPPGTIGHSIFVEPLFKALTVTLDDSGKQWMTPYLGTIEDSPRIILVSESLIALSIDRLKTLALQHPNPGLVKRLVYPVLVPLWGLACYSHEQQNIAMHEKIMVLLQAYFGISVGVQPLKKLVDNLLWDGGPTWEYFSYKTRGVSIKERDAANTNQFNFVRLMDSLQSRVELFVSLLGSDPNSEERTGDIFLYVSETWLVKPSAARGRLGELKLPGESEGPDSVIRKLVSAKVAEKLMDSFKDTLSQRPLRVLELINQIIGSELSQSDVRKRRSADVSLSSLANVVNRHDEQEEVSAEDSTDSLAAVFSLLSTVLASPEFATSRELIPVLEDIKSQLDQLIPDLPPSLAKPGRTASMLLEIQLTSPEQSKAQETPQFSDLDTHRRALTNLNSDLPPVQAEGFSLLSELIRKFSPVLDIPSTLTLLLSIITDTSETAANDEFIYLNAIKLIGTLASRHPRTVVKTLVERYTDRKEEIDLDQRLKLGESLLRTVQDLGETLTGDIGRILGDGMIAVAGRRGYKPETQKRRKQQIEKERRQKEREERQNKELTMPPGLSIPKLEPLPEQHVDDEDPDSEAELPEQTAHFTNIISAWAAGATSDEEPDDLRARTSAISILASAVQTNIAGLGPLVASSAVDLALSTLVLEPEPEAAILRRASAIILLDILKALDNAREKHGGRGVGFGFSLSDEIVGGPNNTSNRGPSTIGNIPHMLRTLHFVESWETDGIVRGHVRALVESLEAWMEKTLLYGIGARGEDDEVPRLELSDRIAGLSVDPMTGRDGSQRPRIEEIE